MLQLERAIDQVLADSFPASDPPPWTLGVSFATLEPHGVFSSPIVDTRSGKTERVSGVPTGVVETRGFKEALIDGLGSFVGVIAVAWCFPVAILIIGIPIVLAIRLIGEAMGWLISAAP